MQGLPAGGNHEVLGEMPKRVLPERQPVVAKPSALTPNFTNYSNFINILDHLNKLVPSDKQKNKKAMS